MPLPVNKVLPLTRLVVFGTVTLFSFITLALSAHILDWTSRWFSSYFDFAALAVAVSILSLLTLPAMICISRVRSGAVPCFIAVELGWTSFLCVLWLASAATTASINGTGGRCGGGSDGWSTFCGEVNAVEAFAFLNWLILMVYLVALLFFSIMAFQAGNRQIWTSSVNQANFEGGPNAAHNHEKYPGPVGGSTFAPQYPPSNVAAGTTFAQPVHQPAPGTTFAQPVHQPAPAVAQV